MSHRSSRAIALALFLSLPAAPLALGVAVESTDDACVARAAVPGFDLRCPSRAVPLLWESADDGAGDERHTHIDVGPDGVVYSATVRNNPGVNILSVRALDGTTGAILWTSETTAPGFAVAVEVVFDAGRVISATERGHVVALDAATGTLLWTTSIDGVVLSAMARGGGDVLLFGHTRPGFDFATFRLDGATGAEEWRAIETSPIFERAAGGGLSGGLVVAAGYESSPAGTRALVRAYDAATGAPAWSLRDDAMRGVLATAIAGSTLYLTGTSAPGDDVGLAAYDIAAASRIWAASFDFSFDSDIGYAVLPDPASDSVFVTGRGTSSAPGTSSNQYVALTLSFRASTGDLVWRSWYSESSHGEESGRSLALSEGTLYATGATCPVQRNGCGRGATDVLTVAYDAATGLERWASPHRLPAGDAGDEIAVSPDGARVHVGATMGYDYDVYTTGSLILTYPTRTVPQRIPVVAVEEGDADAELLAVSTEGRARGKNAASVSGPAEASDGFAISLLGPSHAENVAASGAHEAEGLVAASAAGTARGNQAVSLLGDAEGGIAVAPLGDAFGSTALSVLGDADGPSPFTVAGRCNGVACVAVEPTDAEGHWVGVGGDDAAAVHVAASASGDADGGLLAIAPGGEASGCDENYVAGCTMVSGRDECMVYRDRWDVEPTCVTLA